MEQLIDLLEENSWLWDVSNKDYYLRKKRERAYKQIEEKLGSERAVIKAKIATLRQQSRQLLRSFASANNSQHCWAQQCDLLGPFAWALTFADICLLLHVWCFSNGSVIRMQGSMLYLAVENISIGRRL